MEGDDYVKLLFEDESYTRSRTYFWILGCLRVFEDTIRNTKKHWETFQDSYISPFKNDPEYQSSAACKIVKDIDTVMASLDRIEGEFGAMRTQVTLLRDGVCSTCGLLISNHLLTLSAALQCEFGSGESGVHQIWGEYKTSHLREHFYLPLAFCAVCLHQCNLAHPLKSDQLLYSIGTLGNSQYS